MWEISQGGVSMYSASSFNPSNTSGQAVIDRPDTENLDTHSLDSQICQYQPRATTATKVTVSSFRDSCDLSTAKAPPDYTEKRIKLPTRLGPYTLQKILGKGGHGIVYEAVHRDSDRLVAIKMLRRQIPSWCEEYQENVETLRKEAVNLARFEHPNIIKIFEAGQYQTGDFSEDYMVTEYLLGPKISSLRRAAGVCDAEMTLVVLEDIADALSAVEQEGMIHRDVKPGNIMLDPLARRIKLLDFGLAKLVGAQDPVNDEEDTKIWGTPAYVPPESFLGWDEDIRRDIYALGLTGYEMLVGEQPFKDCRRIAVLSGNVMVKGVPEMPERCAKEPVRMLIAKMTHISPECRHENTEDLLEHIRFVKRKVL